MEAFIGRLIFKLLFLSQSVERNREQISAYAEEIQQFVAQYEDETLMGRKPIPKMPGIIEVMRDWSPYMTIHHLNLVHREIIQMIHDLEARKEVEIGDLSRFDHFDEQGRGVMPDFTHLIERIKALPNTLSFTSTQKVKHPFFGTLTSRGYYAVLAMHLKLHLDQIKKSIQLNKVTECDCC